MMNKVHTHKANNIYQSYQEFYTFMHFMSLDSCAACLSMLFATLIGANEDNNI